MTQRKVSASEFVADIRNGMSNADLQVKYHTSLENLERLFNKLVTAGHLKQSEIDSRAQPPPEFNCPACGATQENSFCECPKCGIIVAKFNSRREKAISVVESSPSNSTTEKIKETSVSPLKTFVTGIYLYWFLGGIFLLFGLSFLFYKPIPGILFIIMSFILLPPSVEFIEKIIKNQLSTGIKIYLGLILCFVGTGLLTTNKAPTQPVPPSQATPAPVKPEVLTPSQKIEKNNIRQWTPPLVKPKPETKTEPNLSKPTSSYVEYEILETKDLSIATAKRMTYRVAVPHDMTKEELTTIAQKIIQTATSKQSIDAIGIFFYLPDTDTNGGYSAGKADWAPGGDWSKASKRIPHELVVIAGNALGLGKEDFIKINKRLTEKRDTTPRYQSKIDPIPTENIPNVPKTYPTTKPLHSKYVTSDKTADGRLVTNGGQIACFSKDSVEEMVTFAVAKDKSSFESYIKLQKCLVLKDGIEVTVMEYPGMFGGYTKFAYHGVMLWTTREGIKF